MRTPWASIAKIEVGGRHSGTGFLVAPSYLVTALHVVATPEGRPLGDIVLRFNPAAERDDGSGIVTMTATLEADLWSNPHDFAVLKCQHPQLYAKPLVLAAKCRQYRDFNSPGFACQETNGFTGIGRIASLNEPDEGGGSAIGLQFDFGSGILMKGHSGAPVLVDGRAVGLLRTAFLDPAEKTMGGLVQATAIRHVVECCNRLDNRLLRYHANISWPTAAPTRSPVMADRKQEFGEFVSMITGQTPKRVLLLKGGSGLGKTEIAEEFAEYARALGVTVATVDLKGCPAMEQIFESLIFSAGEDAFPLAESGAGPARFLRLVDDLVALERPFLLAIDNWQQATDQFRQWIGQTLFSQLDRMPHVVVLITGHNIPDPGVADWAEFAISRELPLIHVPDDWLEFCQRKWPFSGITRHHIEGILLAAPEQLKPNAVFAYLDKLQGSLHGGQSAGARSGACE